MHKAADLLVLLFGLFLMFAALPAMAYLGPIASRVAGTQGSWVWTVTCLLAEVVGFLCAFTAAESLEK